MIEIELVTRDEKEIGVVHLATELTAVTADEFRKQLALWLGKGVLFFVIDFEQVDFIDSSGLGSIISMTKRIRDLNGDIKLAALQPVTQNVFKVVRADRYFPQHETVEDALESLCTTGNSHLPEPEEEELDKPRKRFRWF